MRKSFFFHLFILFIIYLFFLYPFFLAGILRLRERTKLYKNILRIHVPVFHACCEERLKG